MEKNMFLDRSQQPSNADVRRVLGKRWAYFKEFEENITGVFREEWKHYGAKIGWTLKLIAGKRNLCFVSIRKGYFVVSFVFGEKAVRAVEESGLPSTLVQELLNARKYVEGRGLRLTVTSRRVLEQSQKLLKIKQAN